MIEVGFRIMTRTPLPKLPRVPPLAGTHSTGVRAPLAQ